MMLPAAIGAVLGARHHRDDRDRGRERGCSSGYAGLLLSFHTGVPAGPAVILVAGVLYVVSVLFGRVGGAGAAARSRDAISKREEAGCCHAKTHLASLRFARCCWRNAGSGAGAS